MCKMTFFDAFDGLVLRILVLGESYLGFRVALLNTAGQELESRRIRPGHRAHVKVKRLLCTDID